MIVGNVLRVLKGFSIELDSQHSGTIFERVHIIKGLLCLEGERYGVDAFKM